jgi:hypothetical protein
MKNIALSSLHISNWWENLLGIQYEQTVVVRINLWQNKFPKKNGKMATNKNRVVTQSLHT